jgi:hypothetical protein
MGFLIQDTNNIIVDAVLTNYGRRSLARNDGSFSIQKFAFGDDEVDYTLIKKFGRTIGKEKIEKNTPVYEALTTGDYAQKYKLLFISDPNLAFLPSISLVSPATDITLTIGKKQSQSLTIEQALANNDTISTGLLDLSYTIEINNLFLQIDGVRPVSLSPNNLATYSVLATGRQSNIQGTSLNFSLSAKSVSSSLFTIFGSQTNKNVIETIVKVTGNFSGRVVEFSVTINKN